MPRTLVLLVFALFTTDLGAAIRYVAPRGNDRSGDGSMNKPFATITRAASVSKAGDIVNVRGGVYRQEVVIDSVGTAGQRVIIRSQPGEQAILDGSRVGDRTTSPRDLVTIRGRYVDFTGFEVRNATRLGVAIWGATHVRVTSNVVHHNHRGGIYAGHRDQGLTSDVLIAYNDVYDNVLVARGTRAPGGWPQAIGIHRARRVNVTGNRVFRNYGEGIIFSMSDSGVAHNNEVFDNFAVGIYLDHAQDIVVDSNRVYSTGDRRFFRNGQPANGILLANEDNVGQATKYTARNRVSNNLVSHAQWGLGFWKATAESADRMTDCTFENNRVYGATRHAVYIEGTEHRRVRVENNEFARGATSVFVPALAHGVTVTRARL